MSRQIFSKDKNPSLGGLEESGDGGGDAQSEYHSVLRTGIMNRLGVGSKILDGEIWMFFGEAEKHPKNSFLMDNF